MIDTTSGYVREEYWENGTSGDLYALFRPVPLWSNNYIENVEVYNHGLVFEYKDFDHSVGIAVKWSLEDMAHSTVYSFHEHKDDILDLIRTGTVFYIGCHSYIDANDHFVFGDCYAYEGDTGWIHESEVQDAVAAKDPLFGKPFPPL